MNHRSEIDGLRAVAVLPVLLSHAGLVPFAGGFVGVDVFFVISGYLITGIILSELAEQRFSIANFYERRVRRILPALFLVMAVSIPLAWTLMSADALKNFGQSVVATTLFSNNILLTVTSSYWEAESTFKPLLHTWSLGVEEQYYVIVPIALMAVHSFARRHVSLVIILIGVASLALCLWAVGRFPAANFYGLPTRAWELAAGGAAASLLRGRRGPSVDGLALIGLAMIAGAVLLLPTGAASPAVSTLLPVTGTVLVLVFCRSGISQRLLTWPQMVGMGLVSYSTYLWHQPLFAFLRIVSPDEPPVWQFCALVPVAILLAYLTWRFVENPFRDRRRVSRRLLVVILTPAAALLIGFGAYVHLAGGVPQRFDQAPGVEAAGAYKAYNMAVYESKRDAFAAGSDRRLLVVGNSTARDFVNMVRATGTFAGWDIVYRDDLIPCDVAALDPVQRGLIENATLIVILVKGVDDMNCTADDIARAPAFAGRVVFVGPKDFGENLNPVARLPLDERQNASVRLSRFTRDASADARATTPPDLYVDIIRHLSPDDDHMPIFDEAGRILSEDRVHVTRAGAAFVGSRIFTDPIWPRVIAASIDRQNRAGTATR